MSNFKKILLTLIPAFAAFGPVFIVISLPSDGHKDIAYIGALFTGLSILMLYKLICLLEREIGELKSEMLLLKNAAPKSPGDAR